MSNTNTCVRTDNIDSSMGGNYYVLGERLSQVLELIGTVPFDGYKNVLDIRIAQNAKWFTGKGIEVTGTGLEISSYDININELQFEQKIKIVDCNVEKIPFEDKSFDNILISHILEHCNNTGLALQEVKGVIYSNGVLYIFVPPHDNFFGRVRSINWDIDSLIKKENRTAKNKLLSIFLSLIHRNMKYFFAVKLYRLSRLMNLNLKKTKFHSPN